MKDKKNVRDARKKRIPVAVSENEDKIIAEKARNLGLDKTVFLRMLGMKYNS
jgi:hypothetical protein